VRSWTRALVLCAAALLPATVAPAAPPRLVVVVVIDQFPREYLDRFAPLFGPDGFRRLLDAGADFTQCHHEHFLTATAPGHAVMLTGAYPVQNGIVGNYWYARAAGHVRSSVDDPGFPLISGAEAPGADAKGGVSPLALAVPTVGDGLRAATGMRARVVSVAIKDRGAVLLGGWRPNGVYFYAPRTCRFATSTYYAPHLPQWAAAFNAAEPCAPYLGQAWMRLRAEADYARFAEPDDAPYEGDVYGLGRTFPHPVREWVDEKAEGAARDKDRYAAVVGTPFGNALLWRFAQAAVVGEQLGADDVPDLLTISFSSNDYVGHTFGPHSQEVLDITLRTDALLAELFAFFDARVGRGRWWLALTSDHGVAPVPEYLERNGMLPPRDDHYRYRTAAARAAVEATLLRRFFGGARPKDFPGFFESWEVATDPFVYVNTHALAHLKGASTFDALLDAIADEIERVPGVAHVYRRHERAGLAASHDAFAQRAVRAWHPANGGDLLIQLAPHWLTGEPPNVTNHRTPYRYDTHVPMLLYGAGVRRGHFHRPVAVVDLASTVARVLGVAPAPADEGTPLVEALD
jgi:hypothetical protein